MYSSIIVTGSIGYDVIMDYPGKFIDQIQPKKLHQLNLSFVVDNLEKQLGGIATNISYNLSLLTRKKVNVIGAVGKDSAELLSFFKKNKINHEGIVKDSATYSATGSVVTDIKDNQIWTYCYGASKLGKNIDLKKYLNKNSLVVISACHPDSMINFQNQTIKLKSDYIYDPGLALGILSKKTLISGIKNCNWLVGNDYEIALILKILNLSINQLIEWGIKVITTLGEKGVKYQDKNHSYYVSAYKVKKVVDPTGAGDAWRGGFLAGIVEGKSIKESLKLGNVLASFAVEKYGTVNHKPIMVEINKRLKSLN